MLFRSVSQSRYKLPDLPARSFVPYSPFDYMGLPTSITGIFKYVTAFHSRAINLIWNEYYRDQDLQNSRPVPTSDGPDNIDANLYQILPSRKKTLETLSTSLLPSSLIFPHDLSSLTHLSITWDYQLILPAFSNMLLPFTLAL